MAQATLQSHPAPSLQKAISQKFRRDQVALANATGEAVGQVWDRHFSIKHARDSWARMYPAITAIVQRGFVSSQASATTYYDTCRMSAGLGPLPSSVKVKPVTLAYEHADQSLASTGLGWFLHMVKGGAQMVDAAASARSLLASTAGTLVLSGGRDWLANTAEADPDAAGVRRVTGGTCAFCEDLASQGVDPATARHGEGWHDNCQCTSEPAFGSDTGPSPSLPSSDVTAAPASEVDDLVEERTGVSVGDATSQLQDLLGNMVSKLTAGDDVSADAQALVDAASRTGMDSDDVAEVLIRKANNVKSAANKAGKDELHELSKNLRATAKAIRQAKPSEIPAEVPKAAVKQEVQKAAETVVKQEVRQAVRQEARKETRSAAKKEVKQADGKLVKAIDNVYDGSDEQVKAVRDSLNQIPKSVQDFSSKAIQSVRIGSFSKSKIVKDTASIKTYSKGKNAKYLDRVMGLFNRSDSILRINTAFPAEEMPDTVIHEAMHGFDQAIRMTSGKDASASEEWHKAYDAVLEVAYRQNLSIEPHLMSYSEGFAEMAMYYFRGIDYKMTLESGGESLDPTAKGILDTYFKGLLGVLGL